MKRLKSTQRAGRPRSHLAAINLIVAGLYVILGKAGLLLALPPGFATLVWPAAGLAVTVALVWRIGQIWSGILLGAFLVNASIGGVFSPNVLALAIAFGSTLQAGLCAWAVRRSDPALDFIEGRALLGFVGAAALCSTVAASIGNASLWTAGIIGVDALPRSLFTWWLGDLLGILIGVPLLLSFVDARPLWRRRRIQVAIPVSAAVLLCALVYASVRADELSRLKDEFSRQADVLLPALSRFDDASRAVLILSIQSTTEENRTSDRFARNAAALRLAFPNLQSLNWLPFVPVAARGDFERQISQQSGRPFVVKPLPKHDFADSDWLAPVALIEPLAGNEPALGRDLMSEAVRRQAIEKARDERRVTATDKIVLVQDREGPGGLLILAPVMVGDWPIGVVSAVVNLRTLLKPLMEAKGIQWHLRDSRSGTVISDTLGEKFSKPVGALQAFNDESLADGSGIFVQRRFMVADREYQLVLHRPYAKFVVKTLDGPVLVIIMSLLTCAGLGLFMLLQSASAERTEQMVVSRTAQLSAEIMRRDLSERALIGARKAAEEANQAKSEFLSSMSHELRTPLNAVLGYAQLFARDPTLSPEQSEDAREIVRGGNLLLALITDVLDLSHIESGKLAITLGSLTVGSLTAQSFTLVAGEAEKAGIALIDAGGDGQAAVIAADPVRLLQVVLNLLSNGIKYNRPGGSVSLAYALREGAVRIVVTDTGLGIPADKAHRVFVGFDRLGRENGAIEGTGIGLLIAKRIVEAMGGAIGFESAEGQGSTFWVEFGSAGVMRSGIPGDPPAS